LRTPSDEQGRLYGRGRETHQEAVDWALSDMRGLERATLREAQRVADQATYALGDRPVSDLRNRKADKGR
jgi:hypothetical protein